MKIVLPICLFLFLVGCSTTPKKTVKKVNTEVYTAICFNMRDIEYQVIDNVEMISFDEKGFQTKIKGEPVTLPNNCIFEQKYRVKKQVKLPPEKFSISCKFDPFYYKIFEGTGYSLYKVYDEGTNLKMVEPKSRQILLLSGQYCDVLRER